jgi:ketosteroid isomerase-like protein
MAAALQKNDVGYMEKLYTENYMFVAPDGSVVTGAQRIASMKSGETKYESIKYDDVSVRSNAEGNGAVSISRATVKGTNLGKPVDGQFRVTHVWSKTKDGWKLANGQTTPITGAAAAPVSNTANSTTKSPPAANTANANK